MKYICESLEDISKRISVLEQNTTEKTIMYETNDGFGMFMIDMAARSEEHTSELQSQPS